MSLLDLFRKKREPRKEENPKSLQDLSRKKMAADPVHRSDSYKFRYAFEHQIFRDHFFANPKINMLVLSQPGAVAGLYEFICQKTGNPFPYQKSDFVTNVCPIPDGGTLLCIEMPKPETAPLCHRIYLLANEDYTKTGYYTIEASIDGACLCRWKGDTHQTLQHIESVEWKPSEKGLMMSMEHVIIMKMFSEQ